MDFYDCLSMQCFSVVPTGTTIVFNYASYVYLSIKGTLDSINLLLEKGRINDSYVLVRKLCDDVLVEIFMDVLRKENFDWMEKPVVQDVENWVNAKFRIPKLKTILNTLKESKCSKDLYPFFGWETYLKNNRELLDDSVHSNRYSRFLINCNDVVLSDRNKHLQNISIILSQLFTIHLSFLFYLNPQYLMATDYKDSLEMCGMPIDGSENWIAPYAQTAFDNYIKPNRHLATFIKENCFLKIE